MFKVTLKIKPGNEWVDGPVMLVSAEDMDAFSQTHEYFKCGLAIPDDSRLHPQWEPPKARVPSAFMEFIS